MTHYIPVDNVFLSCYNDNDDETASSPVIILGLNDDESSNSELMMGWKSNGVFDTVDLTERGYIKPYFTDVQLQLEKNTEFNNLTVYPQLEVGTEATEYEPYTETGVGDKTKNLIPYPYTIGFNGQTEVEKNGITFTDNGDGSITANGTTTEQCYLTLVNKLPVTPSTFVLSGCPNGGSSAGYQLTAEFRKDNTWVVSMYNYDGSNNTRDLSSYDFDNVTVRIFIRNADVTIKNITFYPMLELGKAASSYEPYGYKIPIVNTQYKRERNLISYPYTETTKTTNGVTFTDNGDGSITVNGTATESAYYTINGNFENRIDRTKTYILFGGVYDDIVDLYMVLYQDTIWKKAFYCKAKPVVIDFSTLADIEFNNIKIIAYVYKGITADNVTIYPQLEVGTEATEYDTFPADTTTIYTTTQLKDGESISFKADDLPQLQLYKGENNITVDTEVEPSEITVKYKD